MRFFLQETIQCTLKSVVKEGWAATLFVEPVGWAAQKYTKHPMKALSRCLRCGTYLNVLPAKLIHKQSAELRKQNETRDTALSHLRFAASFGGKSKIKASVLATGIKDSASAPIIDSLIEMKKSIKKDNPAMSSAEVGKLLSEELEKQLLRDPTNPLIGMAGAWFFFFFSFDYH